jgi:hypothetical protein
MQYSLATLFLVFFFVAATLAAFGVPGIWIAIVFLLTALGLNRSASFASIGVALFVAGFFSIPAFLWPLIKNAREAARFANCTCPLGMFGCALQNYHASQQHCPSAITYDKDGKPLFNWIVPVLPEIDYEAIYRQLNKNEPWNSSFNTKVLSQISNHEFQCPSANHEVNDSTTNYVAIIGPGTAWRSDGPVKLSDLPDGGSHTVMLVEVADSGLHWAEPVVFTMEQALERMKTGKGLRISSNHPSNIHLLLANGRATSVPSKMPLSLWKKLLTGELSKVQIDNIKTLIDPIAPDMVEVSTAPKGFEPGTYAILTSLFVWIVSLLLLFRRAIKSHKKPDTEIPNLAS